VGNVVTGLFDINNWPGHVVTSQKIPVTKVNSTLVGAVFFCNSDITSKVCIVGHVLRIAICTKVWRNIIQDKW
jgi:hypothetical protein